MVGHHHPARPGAATIVAPAATTLRYAGFHFLTAARRNEDYDPASIDRIAERERQRLVAEGVLDAEPVRIYKLKCQACLVLIGPGYVYDEVWLDLTNDRWVCRSCALWPSVDPTTVRLLASRQEVAMLAIGELGRLLKRRTRNIKRENR